MKAFYSLLVVFFFSLPPFSIFFFTAYWMLWQKTKAMVTLARSGLSFSLTIKPGPGLARSWRVCVPKQGPQGLLGWMHYVDDCPMMDQ